MKTCIKCKLSKDVSEFSKGNDQDGLHYWCRRCVKQYYENNHAKLTEQKKQYYENNTERIRQYYKNNKIKIIERSKQYYENNKIKIAEK